MSHQSLFDKKEIQKKLKEFHPPKSTESSFIFARWHDNLSSTSQGGRRLGERQLGADFLNDIFGEVLGYIYKIGEKEKNLEKEEKTELDGQKPDGILGFLSSNYKDVRVVIELKDQKTDLSKKQNRQSDKRTPIEQAFGYVSKYQGMEWVIVSNFKEIRLYKADYAGEYHAFTIEELAIDEDKRSEFYFLLAKDRLFTKTPNKSPTHALKISEKGEEIEKRFYKHYSSLREEIWHNLIELNHEKHYGRNFYLYKAQKLIDRIIFIRFCRENGALDNDAVLEALNNKFTKGKYNRMKALFTAMDEGNPEIGIAKFNGGLFAKDSDLDCLNISDEIIEKIVILYAHDFGSDLDVNILGHIFEQSISDLESLTGDNEKKRKKDGVFYTPAYITEYIVREAIGGWLSDRKAEIKEEENSTKWWEKYAEKLKSIKVLDPACGSGAFLVKVFDYLQNEWQEVEKHIKTEWTYKNILIHNIYGVDINVASTGITKLSLWLKTAHYREPLTTLDDNIKIGNSLIDDPDIAGYYSEFEGKFVQEIIEKQASLFAPEQLEKDKTDIESQFKKSLAFKWNKEFEKVFSSGGFDVVVGNPPYVYSRNDNFTTIEQKHFRKHYRFIMHRLNTFFMFIDRSYNLLKINGCLGFIIPNNWMTVDSFSDLRKFIINDTSNLKICNIKASVFESASVDTSLLNFRKNNQNTNIVICEYNDNQVDEVGSFTKDRFIAPSYIININSLKNSLNLSILQKINSTSTSLSEVADVKMGIVAYLVGDGTPTQTNIMKENRIYHSRRKESEDWLKYLDGIDVCRYYNSWSGQYVKYGKNLARRGKIELFTSPRILLRQIPSNSYYSINATFVSDIDIYVNDINSTIITNPKINILFLLAVINSRLSSFWIQNTFDKFQRKIFPQLKGKEIKQFPIPQINPKAQLPLIAQAQKMLDLSKNLNELSNKFLKLLFADLSIKKTTKKLEKWYNLQVDEFFVEASKQNKNLSLSQKSGWLDHFEIEKTKALALQKEIAATDDEIDQMVYRLYGLNDEEIKIVDEGYVKQ